MLIGTLRIIEPSAATGQAGIQAFNPSEHRATSTLVKNDMIIVISCAVKNEQGFSEIKVLTRFGPKTITQFALRYMTVSESYTIQENQ